MSSPSASANETRSPIIASWVLLIATCILAVIPFVGFVTWFIGGVTITIAIVLAVVVISKGGTWNGIFILLASLIVVPCVIIVGPILSSLIAGAAIDQANPDSEPLIEMTSEALDSASEIEDAAARETAADSLSLEPTLEPARDVLESTEEAKPVAPQADPAPKD